MTYVCLFTWVCLCDWSLLEHPSALSTHNGLISLLSPPFLPPLLSFARLLWMLNHGPCLPGACKHTSRTIGQNGGVTLCRLAEGKGAWVAKEEGVGGYHRPTGWLLSIVTYQTRTHTALPPQDTVKIPTDSQNTNTLRHMTHPLTSSTTKDFQSVTHVKYLPLNGESSKCCCLRYYSYIISQLKPANHGISKKSSCANLTTFP